MDNISIDLVGQFLGFLVAFVGGLGYLNKTLRSWLTKLIREEISGIKDHLQEVDLNACKNFLVKMIPDIESGEIDEVQKQRFYEQYEHYLSMGGNTYIKNKVENLQKKGLI